MTVKLNDINVDDTAELMNKVFGDIVKDDVKVRRGGGRGSLTPLEILWHELMKEQGDYDAAMHNLVESMCRGNASISGTGKTFENFGKICHQMFYDDITKDDLAEDSESVDENEFLSLISKTMQEEKL